VRLAANESFQLIFMDVQMPVMDGLRATAVLRDQGAMYPIIGCTGNVAMGEVEECVNSGMNGILPKPVSRPGLEHLLRAWLQHMLPPVPPLHGEG